jgi:hypothetical protein
MAIQYRLTIATDIATDRIAHLAIEEPEQRPTPSEFSDGLLSAELYQQRGFHLSIQAGQGGYYDADADDDSLWVWEPTTYVDLTFSLDKDETIDKGIPNMLEVVKRVLQATTEDAALIQDDNWLLLTRRDGIQRKHRRARWWDHYDFANDIIPD